MVDSHRVKKSDLEGLATEFSCSCTPIREALQSLEVSGLVMVEPKRGTFVTELGVTELTERFEVMAELEALCARLAATRATADQLAGMRAAQSSCELAAIAGDSDDSYRRNTAFHQAIYAGSRNRFLEAEALRLQVMLQPYWRRQVHLRGRMQRSVQEHRNIAEQIEAGNAEGASAEMHAHVIIQGDGFHELATLLRTAR